MKTAAVGIICSIGLGLAQNAPFKTCSEQRACTTWTLNKLDGDNCDGCEWELCFNIVFQGELNGDFDTTNCPTRGDELSRFGYQTPEPVCDPVWNPCDKEENVEFVEIGTRCFKAGAGGIVQFIFKNSRADCVAGQYTVTPENVDCPSDPVPLDCGMAPSFVNPGTQPEQNHDEQSSVCGGGATVVKSECMWQMIMPECCTDTSTESTTESKTTTPNTTTESTTTPETTESETTTPEPETTTVSETTTPPPTLTPTQPPTQDLGSLPANIHTAIGNQMGYDLSGLFGVEAKQVSAFQQSAMYSQRTAVVFCVGLVAGISTVLLVSQLRPGRHPERPPLEHADLLTAEGWETQRDDQ